MDIPAMLQAANAPRRSSTAQPSAADFNSQIQDEQDGTQRMTSTRSPNLRRPLSKLLTQIPDAAEEHVETEAAQLPRPAFHPLFTVVEDAMTGSQHHPHVRYVFSDDGDTKSTEKGDDEEQEEETADAQHDQDDAEPDAKSTGRNNATYLTEAILSVLDPQGRAARAQSGEDDLSDSAEEPSLQGAEQNGNEKSSENERYLIVDLAPDGSSVSSIKGLCPDWQVTKADLRDAPTFGAVLEGSRTSRGDRKESEEGEQKSRMLRIEGVGLRDDVAEAETEDEMVRRAQEKCGGDVLKGLEALVEECRSDMEMYGPFGSLEEGAR